MSTSNALTRLVQSMKDGFHKKKSTLAVFVDFKGAYDTCLLYTSNECDMQNMLVLCPYCPLGVI